MKTENTTTARLSKNGEFIIVTVNGKTGLVNANLVKYLLGVSYTKKDGTLVSSDQIQVLKRKSQEAYAKAIIDNTTTGPV